MEFYPEFTSVPTFWVKRKGSASVCEESRTWYWESTLRGRQPTRDIRAVVIRMTLLPTARLFWHCGDHTAKPESAYR